MTQGEAMKKIALAAVLAAVLSGCATTPTSLPSATGNMIVIALDTGLMGAGCRVAISIDDQPVGLMSTGETLKREVESGDHKITAGTGEYAQQSICPDLILTRLVVMKGKPAYFRFGWIAAGVPMFEQVK